MKDLTDAELQEAERHMKKWVGGRSIFFIVPPEERRAFLAGFLFGRRHAPLPQSIQEALNSGDGSYKP